jgi:hypothetical protein
MSFNLHFARTFQVKTRKSPTWKLIQSNEILDIRQKLDIRNQLKLWETFGDLFTLYIDLSIFCAKRLYIDTLQGHVLGRRLERYALWLHHVSRNSPGIKPEHRFFKTSILAKLFSNLAPCGTPSPLLKFMHVA